MSAKSRWFSAGDGRSISYDTPQEIAAFLFEHPDLTSDYVNSIYKMAFAEGAWRDYAGMRRTLMLLVDVLVETAKMNEELFYDDRRDL